MLNISFALSFDSIGCSTFSVHIYILTPACANKVKLSNLQNMTKTLSYVQEHGYDTAEDAEDRLAEIKELATYEAAIKFLKEKAGGGKLPALQTPKAEKEKLLVQKKKSQEKYHYYRDYQKELDTVCTNIHAALGQINNRTVHKQMQERA